MPGNTTAEILFFILSYLKKCVKEKYAVIMKNLKQPESEKNQRMSALCPRGVEGRVLWLSVSSLTAAGSG